MINWSDDEVDSQGLPEQTVVQWGATGYFQAKSESIAYHLPLRADLHTYNVLRFHSGPTSYLTRRVVSGCQLTSFRILFGEPTLRKKCSVEEGRTQTGDHVSDVFLCELEIFMCLMVARGVMVGYNLLVTSSCGKSCGWTMFSQTMPRNKFLEILRYLRFDLKKERCRLRKAIELLWRISLKTNVLQLETCWIYIRGSCKIYVVANARCLIAAQMIYSWKILGRYIFKNI